MVKMIYKKIFFQLFALIFCFNTSAQLNTETKQGPYEQLIIRGATLINGDGSPPRGPVDIVIEKNIIKKISFVGYPGVKIDSTKRPSSS